MMLRAQYRIRWRPRWQGESIAKNWLLMFGESRDGPPNRRLRGSGYRSKPPAGPVKNIYETLFIRHCPLNAAYPFPWPPRGAGSGKLVPPEHVASLQEAEHPIVFSIHGVAIGRESALVESSSESQQSQPAATATSHSQRSEPAVRAGSHSQQ